MRYFYRMASLAAALICVPVTLRASPPPLGAPLRQRIDADVGAVLRRYDVPGAVVEILKDGHVVYARAYGLRDHERGLATRLQTHFEIGSITKQFTAAAILQLQEAGKLSIDDKVVTYLPDAPHASEITLRQLLSHTSGLPNYFYGSDIQSVATRPISYADLIGRISDKPLDFKPGEKWSYSNTGYVMLGRIIELLSHETYRDYLVNHLFGPAGLSDTYTVADEAHLKDMAVGYQHVTKKLERSPTISESFGWAAGCIVSTAHDLASWNEALRGGKIISHADYALMATSVTTQQGDAGYGLALFVDEVDGEARVGHTGGSFGFTTANEYFPKQTLQIIAFTNLGDDTPEPGEVLTTAIFEDLHPALAAAADRPAPGADPETQALAATTFAGLQGESEDYSRFNNHLGEKLKAGLAEHLSKTWAGYGPVTAVIFKGKTQVADLYWSYYILRFGPGSFIKFGIAIDRDKKVASLSFG